MNGGVRTSEQSPHGGQFPAWPGLLKVVVDARLNQGVSRRIIADGWRERKLIEMNTSAHCKCVTLPRNAQTHDQRELVFFLDVLIAVFDLIARRKGF